MIEKIKTFLVLILLGMLAISAIWFGLLIWGNLSENSNKKPTYIPNVSFSNSPLELSAEQFLSLTSIPVNIQPAVIEQYINEYRAQNNLSPLKDNSLLTKSAELKADDMIDRNYFAHDSPSGLTPWYFINEAGYTYKKAGENLAFGNYKDERKIVDDWIASPSHKANILNSEYIDVGVSIQKADDFNNSKNVYVIVLHLAH